MTMPSWTFLDKTSILIPRSKAFQTRPRYWLPFLCQDKAKKNSTFHQPVSVVLACYFAYSIHISSSRQIKSMRNTSKYTLSRRQGFDVGFRPKSNRLLLSPQFSPIDRDSEQQINDQQDRDHSRERIGAEHCQPYRRTSRLPLVRSRCVETES